jgi:HlyD family secretion protein
VEGPVREILVAQDQRVEEGSVIATVDDSHFRTEQSKFKTAIENAALQVEQLQAQVSALDQQIAAEQNLLERRQSTAQAELRLREREREQLLVTTAADVREAQAEVDLAREELLRFRSLSEQGVISALELREREVKLSSAEAQLSRVEAALNPSEAEIEIASQNIVQQRASGEATLAMLLRERQQLLQRVTEYQTTLGNYEDDLRQIEADISSAVIRAPVSGVIQEFTLRNSGQMVEQGELVARIALADNALEVKAFVAIQDIGDIVVGQTVFMRVSACPYPDYGTLRAMVTAISPDAITSQDPGRIAERGTGFGSMTAYEVTARPETLVLEDDGRSCKIQAGMEGRADIVSREETVLRFLLRKARLITDI